MPDIIENVARLTNSEEINHKRFDEHLDIAQEIEVPVTVVESAARWVSGRGKSDIRYLVTPTSGRNTSMALAEGISFKQEKYFWVYAKGNGSPLSALESDSPYRTDDRFEGEGGSVSGHLSVSEARKDAEATLKAINMGVRTRVPIAGFLLDEVMVNGQVISSEEFIHQFRTPKIKESQNIYLKDGAHAEHPYLIEYLTRNPFKNLDILFLLQKAITQRFINPELMLALMVGVKTWQSDNLKQYRDLGNKWKEPLEKRRLSPQETYFIVVDAIIAQQQVMAENLARLHGNNLHHGNLHGQNISFFSGELSDFVTMNKGNLLGEMDDDVDIYAEDIERFKEILIQFSGTFGISDHGPLSNILNRSSFKIKKESLKVY